jgi:hypothetical protein
MSTQQELTPEGVLTTIGYTQFVASLFNRDKGGDLSKDFTHAMLGIATELNELRRAHDNANALEEKGDLVFYSIALALVVQDIIGVQFTQEQWESFTFYFDEISEQVGDGDPFDYIDDARASLLDKCKRWIGYGKTPEDYVQTVREALGLVSYAIHQCQWEHDDLQIMLANVDKLLDRYKGLTFNADLAVNRDTASERALLERHAS